MSAPGHVDQVLGLGAGDIGVAALRRPDGDLGQHLGDVIGRDRLHEQRGDGRDTVRYTGPRSGFTVTHTQSGFTVASATQADDVDTLLNVERLFFDDAKVALDITGNAGQAYRLYQAAFDRTPDIGGLGYQMNELDRGMDLTWVAGNFLASPEFQAKYGALSNSQFVNALYANVLHRSADADGLIYHVKNLDAGLPRNWLLVQFSESLENQANVIGTIENGMAYVL